MYAVCIVSDTVSFGIIALVYSTATTKSGAKTQTICASAYPYV